MHTDSYDRWKATKGEHVGHLPAPERQEIREFDRNVKEAVLKNPGIAIEKLHDQVMATANLSAAASALAKSSKQARESPC